MDVKYTDIDYLVFSDAASYVNDGLSPYLRDTYRYTPLLAWILVPNSWGGLWYNFGKFLFILGDILTGYLIILLMRNKSKRPEGTKELILASVWLLNPMVITISTRGSSESILTTIIMLSVYFLVVKKFYTLSAIFLGLSIHFKIYPIIYLPTTLLYLSGSSTSLVKVPVLNLFNIVNIRYLLWTLISFLCLSAVMFKIYGYEFLHHAYLYHLSRIDHRHNFSVYNLVLYFRSASNTPTSFFSGAESIAFLPQLVVSGIILPLCFARSHYVECLFFQTFAFVTFNKVITSQYFIWFLIFLPQYLLNSTLLLRLHYKKGILMLAMWVLAQAAWLNYAYSLEFLGKSTFNSGLFLSSCMFFLTNCWLLGEFIVSL